MHNGESTIVTGFAKIEEMLQNGMNSCMKKKKECGPGCMTSKEEGPTFFLDKDLDGEGDGSDENDDDSVSNPKVEFLDQNGNAVSPDVAKKIKVTVSAMCKYKLDCSSMPAMPDPFDEFLALRQCHRCRDYDLGTSSSSIYALYRAPCAFRSFTARDHSRGDVPRTIAVRSAPCSNC